MPLPNGRFLNWSDLWFQVYGTSVKIPILGVRDVQHDPRAQDIAGQGDASPGPEMRHMTQTDPQFTIELERLAVLATLTPGTKGTFHAIQRDADNGTGPGSMEYTVDPAMIGNTPRGGRYNQYGSGRMTIMTWRPDGETDPVSISVAPPTA